MPELHNTEICTQHNLNSFYASTPYVTKTMYRSTFFSTLLSSAVSDDRRTGEPLYYRSCSESPELHILCILSVRSLHL